MIQNDKEKLFFINSKKIKNSKKSFFPFISWSLVKPMGYAFCQGMIDIEAILIKNPQFYFLMAIL